MTRALNGWSTVCFNAPDKSSLHDVGNHAVSRMTKPAKLFSRMPLQNCAGGAYRDRTDDLLRAKQVLSQLSYTPKDEFRILEFGLSF